MKIKKRYLITFSLTLLSLVLAGILSTQSSVEAFGFYKRKNYLASKIASPTYSDTTIESVPTVRIEATNPQEIELPTTTPIISLTPIQVVPTVTTAQKIVPTQTGIPIQKKVLGITASPKITSIPEPPAQLITDVTDTIISLVNKERAAKGLASLTKNQALTNSAKSYAQHLATYDFLSHTGKDGSTMVSRNTAAGYTNYKWMAENVASGQNTAEQVMTSWMNSQGHRDNILSLNAKEIGVGYVYNQNSKYKYFWVQDFGAR